MRFFACLLLSVLMASSSGCILGNRPSFIHTGSGEHEKTFYLDGAGNLGFGKETVPLGLADGGYQGQLDHFIWTTYMGLLMDQVSYSHNRRQGQRLADKIEDYLDHHPGAQVNIIGLSAGSGVAVFALESLGPNYHVNEVIMLSSSLSADYDLSRALRRLSGGLWCFWSPNDPILRGVVPVVGTVDRANTTYVAGVTGAKPPPGASRETRDLYRLVHNIRWYSEGTGVGPLQFRHAGTTARSFIRDLVAPILVGTAPPNADRAMPAQAPATRPTTRGAW